MVKDLDLAQAGAAVAKDEAAKVKLWLDNGNLIKVDDELAQSWSKEPKEKNFHFIIVQPYVFIKLAGQ